MKKLKHIISWTIWGLLGLYVSLVIIIQLPFMQRWLGQIVAGAIGNIIDSAFYGMALGVGDPRFMYGSVVDMIYVRLFMLPEWFPGFGGEYFFPAIFNFADACVTVGIFAMIIFYKQFFKDEKKKEEPAAEEATSETSQPAAETPQQN